MASVHTNDGSAACSWSAFGRFLPVVKGCNRPQAAIRLRSAANQPRPIAQHIGPVTGLHGGDGVLRRRPLAGSTDRCIAT